MKIFCSYHFPNFITDNCHLINLPANLKTCWISLLLTSQLSSSSLINSGNFLLMSLKALPTDFLTYSLESSFNAAIRLTASYGFSLKYGLLVHILSPSVTALLVLGLLFFNHPSIIGSAFSYPFFLQNSSNKNHVVISYSAKKQNTQVSYD